MTKIFLSLEFVASHPVTIVLHGQAALSVLIVSLSLSLYLQSYYIADSSNISLVQASAEVRHCCSFLVGFCQINSLAANISIVDFLSGFSVD